MSDLLYPILVVAFMMLPVSLQLGWFPRRERPLLLVGFAFHVVAGILQIVITEAVYQQGDLTAYLANGDMLAALLRVNFRGFAPSLFQILIHQEPDVPLNILGTGQSTGTMMALGAFLMYFLDGSRYAANILVAGFSYTGKAALYLALRENFAPHLHNRLLVASLMMPSVVYWSGGMVKEGIAISGVGWFVLGVHWLLSRRYLRGAATAVAGAFVVSLVKAYILFGLALAAGAWFYWVRAIRNARGGIVRIRPAYLLLATLVAIGGIIALGKLFPQYSLDNLGEETAHAQEMGATVVTASYYQMGDPNKRTLGSQIVYIPMALTASFFRPFVFEARNIPMLVNSLETLTLTVMLAYSLLRRRWAENWRTIAASPMLIFSTVFALVFAVAVGLTTTNLGTLSRYRMPLVPFFALVIFVIGAPSIERAARPTRSLRPTGTTRPGAAAISGSSKT